MTPSLYSCLRALGFATLLALSGLCLLPPPPAQAAQVEVWWQCLPVSSSHPNGGYCPASTSFPLPITGSITAASAATATAAAPSYIEGSADPLSQDLSGNLRTILAASSAVIGHTIVDSGTITAVTAITNALPAGANVIGHVIADASTAAIGQVGGFEFKAVSTPTVQNASYVSGNCIGGFNAVTVARANGGGLILDTLAVRSLGGSLPTVTVYLFDANPTASTCTDRSTFTINSADLDKIPAGGIFALPLAVPTGAVPSSAAQTNMALSLIAGGSSASGVQTIYYALVSGSTFTPATTSDIHVSMNGIQD